MGVGRSPRTHRKHTLGSARAKNVLLNVDFGFFDLQNHIGLRGPEYLETVTSIDGHG